MKTITFSMVGKDQEIDDGILGFAKANGWTETVTIDGVEIENPIPVENYASAKMFQYLKETIIAYNANWGSEWGRQQAIEATEQRINQITHSLTIE